MKAPDHPDLGDSLMGVGRALADQGRYDEASESLSDALARYERAFGRDHDAVADALEGRGVAHLGAGRSADAIADLERAYEIRCARAPAPPTTYETAALLDRARAARVVK